MADLFPLLPARCCSETLGCRLCVKVAVSLAACCPFWPFLPHLYPPHYGGAESLIASLLPRFISKEILTIREAVWLTDNTYKYEDLVRMMGEVVASLEGRIRVSVTTSGQRAGAGGKWASRPHMLCAI